MKKIYAQMYSLRKECEIDFKKTLSDVAKMGYAGVEFAGYYNIEANELKIYMDSLGLESLSAHISLDNLANNLDAEIATLKILGAKYIVCPYAEITTVAIAKEHAKILNKIGKVTYENGLTLLYHNHAHELQRDNGEYPLEVLFDNVDTKYVRQQPDVYWIAHAGLDLLDYIVKNANRISVVHLKQIENMDSKKNVDAASGIIDFAKIMQIVPDAECIYEQEYTDGNIVDDMEKSLKTLV